MKLGLVCDSQVLKGQNSSNVFKTLSRAKFIDLRDKSESDAFLTLSDLIIHNLDLTIKIIDSCNQNGISHYRLNSNLLPLISDQSLNFSISDLPKSQDIILKLKNIGSLSKKHDISLSVSPQKYIHLASTDQDSVGNTISELNFLGLILDVIGLDKDYSNPIIIKVNSSTKNCEEIELKQITDRFMSNFKKLDESVKSRLALSNEDKGCWNCGNLFKWFYLYCSAEYESSVPLSYSNLHHNCNPSYVNEEVVSDKQNVDAFFHTWPEEFVPVFEWSEGTEDNPRVPVEYYSEDIPDFEREVIWECDAKASDKAILKLLGKESVAQSNERLQELLALGDSIQYDESKTEEQELEVAKQKIAQVQNQKLSQGFNAIYGV